LDWALNQTVSPSHSSFAPEFSSDPVVTTNFKNAAEAEPKADRNNKLEQHRTVPVVCGH
jgi:hypothetical protein